MDSATPPNGGAQNDSIVGGVQGTFQNKGRVQSCLEQILLNCRYLSVHLTKTGERVCVSYFSHHISRGFQDLPMEATSIHKISIQLLTPENLF